LAKDVDDVVKLFLSEVKGKVEGIVPDLLELLLVLEVVLGDL